jgi:peptide chain release factor 1
MPQDVEEKLIAKLNEIAARQDDLNAQLRDPQIARNPLRIMALGRERARLGRITEPYRELRSIKDHLDEARAILADPSEDPELRQLAQAEVDELQAQHDRMLQQLKEVLVTADDAAITSVIVEIRAGTGGDEAALFARDLYEMYLRYCERKKFKVEVLAQSGSELGGLREIIMNVRGPDVYRCLGYEGGGHRVQRVPETEAQGRIHTSAATVAVLPEPEEINIDVDWDKDVDEFVSRAGGPGGQNVNKVSSAIRLFHKATGITVSMRDEKSQHKNRARARRILLTRLYDHEMQQRVSQRDSLRRTMIGSGDRSQRIRTYNFPQNRCTDHRLNVSFHTLDKIMQGDLDELIAALQTYDT